jgi:predicted RecB family nuclease
MTERLITPTKISEWLGCEHSLALYLRGVAGADHDLNDLATILQEKGLEHEGRVLADYRAAGRKVLEVAMEAHEDFAHYRERVGDPLSGDWDVIYQMPLENDGVRGVADFLVRAEEPDERYCDFEPVDAKLTRAGAKAGHVLQLCFYAEALETMTGRAPRRMHVVLGTGVVETYVVEEFMAYWRRIRHQVLEIFATATLEGTRPRRCAQCDVCAYQPRCQAEWRAGDALEFLAGARREDVDALEVAGVRTVVELAGRPRAEGAMRPERYERLQRQAVLQVRAREDAAGPPPFEAIAPGDDPLYGHGLDELPAPDEGDLFLDFEGDPFWSPASDLLFMAGLYQFDEGEWAYRSRWAHDLDEQRAMVDGLVALFYERRERYPDSHVYHYNHTERSAIARLVEGAAAQDRVAALTLAGYFVDLYPIVRNAFRVGAESYSLKELERLVGFTRATEIQKGAGAVIEYERWMAAPSRTHIDNIEAYNRDDVVATKALRDWVVDQRPSDLAWRAARFERLAVNEDLDALRAGLAELAGERPDSPEALLGHLLSYWTREKAAVRVPLREMLRGERDALFAAPTALAGLTHAATLAPEGRRRLATQRFTYDEQEVDTEFDADEATVAFVDPDGALVEAALVAHDRDARTIDVRLPQRYEGPMPSALALYSYFEPRHKWDALQDVARRVLAHGSIEGAPRAVVDILRGAPPRLVGHRGAVLFGDAVADILSWVEDLDESYAPIQGPPGTGKTFRGGHVIVQLARDAKRVGVTGPSHSAIDNLLGEALKVARDGGVDVSAVRFVHWEKNKQSLGVVGGIEYARSAAAAIAGGAAVIGGTSWLFANPGFDDDPLDLLIVDEAGQVSLADVVAMSRAARSVLLLGDPLQLAHVAQAVHPGRSGESVLEYVLGGHATVPADRGVFLSTTRRMHPDVCDFVSAQMYERRLHADAPCANQTTDFGTGLRWLRAEHEGRSTSAPEEVDLVVAQIASMMGAAYRDRGGRAHELDESSFMVVAPYNAQRRLFRRALEGAGLAGVEVGTVDKFQGREAVVVFFSLTTSSEDQIVRGKEFLFSRNRLNVAISRARSLAYLVCTEALLDARAATVDTMRLISTVNAFVEQAERAS